MSTALEWIIATAALSSATFPYYRFALDQAAVQPSSANRWLVTLARIVARIDVNNALRSHSVQLDYRILASHRIVLHSMRHLHVAASLQRFKFVLVEFFAH